MAAGDTLQGRRLPNDGPIEALEGPGDYERRGDVLWCVLPNGEWQRIDERWQLEEHPDGTLSVVAVGSGEKSSIQMGTWHGYLERGVWREV